MENLFEHALASSGAEYVATERRLRQLVATDSSSALETILGVPNPDPLASLLAEVLRAARGDSRQDYDDLEELFRNLPEESAQTPIGRPQPNGVRNILSRGYGARATKFLALRLAKDPDMPGWLVGGILLYLADHRDVTTTAAILRFAIVTPAASRRALARDALGAIADPALPQKLLEAQRWAETRDLTIPAELRQITPRPDAN